ncbi:MAG: nucleotidyl transferase AbiEii/AbiGii toxin family protein [Patescibacteria group bacterium]
MQNNLHCEILTEKQSELLPLVGVFSKDFGLVGGTAVALHLGHRESIDFDLFSLEEFNNLKIRNKITKTRKIEKVLKDESGHFTFIINQVQFTFLWYPFPIQFSENIDGTIKMPDLLTLASMKAYALGRRQKWKDYVDLYFILKTHYSVDAINKKSKEIFGSEYNEKLFRSQLSYFDGIDYNEEVIYKKGFETDEEVIKNKLTEFSLK